MSTPTPVTIDFINTQFDTLQAAVTKEQSDVTAFITALKAQVGSGVPVTQAQLDALSAKAAGMNTMVSTFDVNTTTPPVVPAPIPAAAKAK